MSFSASQFGHGGGSEGGMFCDTIGAEILSRNGKKLRGRSPVVIHSINVFSGQSGKDGGSRQ